eukprot:SAG11_NODE_18501_length_489_cov_0.923077_1_plen_60_part_01
MEDQELAATVAKTKAAMVRRRCALPAACARAVSRLSAWRLLPPRLLCQRSRCLRPTRLSL